MKTSLKTLINQRIYRILSIFLGIILIANSTASAQKTKEKYNVTCVGFYNLENFYDYKDDPFTNDEEFLPTGSKLYTKEVFEDKVKNLAEVISLLGKDDSPDGVALLGCAEVENQFVLEELVKQPKIKDRNYQIVRYDSPDERGIDVALLYNPKYFKVLKSEPLNVHLTNDDGSIRKTRDVLWVFGLLNGEPVHVFVNHWPSRRGGEEASAPGRAIAAGVSKAKIDSIVAANPEAKVLVMGDLNDDPLSPSVTKVLNATGDTTGITKGRLYNPWVQYYKKGIGTLAYNDAWNLFDQIMLTSQFLKQNQKGYFFQKAVIFNRPFLVQKSGKYKGYPLRTYDFDLYMRGYSDHFPVYVVLLKKMTP